MWELLLAGAWQVVAGRATLRERTVADRNSGTLTLGEVTLQGRRLLVSLPDNYIAAQSTVRASWQGCHKAQAELGAPAP
ncbi:MAG: hypothetical protein HC866_22480 [Leptolyngbyaceae cyanobacterium RU_5_1]|nr:hypothetical protein [Leptolyngbyaceae cyanobacterium RU_5_1]